VTTSPVVVVVVVVAAVVAAAASRLPPLGSDAVSVWTWTSGAVPANG